MHSGDFGTKSHCRKAIVTNFPAGNPKMLCIFGGTDKSVPYNPIVIWSIAKQQFIELMGFDYTMSDRKVKANSTS